MSILGKMQILEKVVTFNQEILMLQVLMVVVVVEPPTDALGLGIVETVPLEIRIHINFVVVYLISIQPLNPF